MAAWFDFYYSYNLLYNLGYDFIVVNNISYMRNSVVFNIKMWDILLILSIPRLLVEFIRKEKCLTNEKYVVFPMRVGTTSCILKFTQLILKMFVWPFHSFSCNSGWHQADQQDN